MPWRALRHSLSVCGLSLVVASGAVIAGAFAQEDDAPSFTRAAASTPARDGESTSIGVLTKLVKQSASPEKPPPGSSGPAAAAATEQASSVSPLGSVAATEASSSATVPTATAPAAALAAAEGGGPSRPLGSQARIGPALTNTAGLNPGVTEVAAERAESMVSASRLQARPSAGNPPPTRVQTSAQTAQPLQPGDRLTVPVTFYYCEDTTGGQRRGDGGGFCGAMRNGAVVHPGAAACDVAYLGQKFRIEGDPTGQVYVCADTGGGIRSQHRDIWFLSNGEGWAWQRIMGTSAVIEILP